MMHLTYDNTTSVALWMRVCKGRGFAVLRGMLLFAMLASLPLSAAHARDIAAEGRDVFDKYWETVVTVRAVVGMSIGGSERESEQEANATLLTNDGLAVLALSAIDPMQMGRRLRSDMNDLSSRVVSLRVILADGTEERAEVVLRDEDLDLVFIRLVDPPDTPLRHVVFDKVGSPEMLDEVVCILQYGRVARRAHAAFIERIEMIVERPRRFYAIGDHRARDMVCSPVFTLAGEFVGIGVMRLITGASDPGFDDMMVIIVPAAQIEELLEQIPPRD